LEEQRWQKLDGVVRVIQRAWRNGRGRGYYHKLKYTASDAIVGHKERNIMSIYRPFKGDYIGARRSGLAKSIAKQFGLLHLLHNFTLFFV
jgi:hypothetical protein